MAFAWGLLAPVGIMLALFYKVVWPTGQWFYAHIVIMVFTLVLSLLGVIPIVVHADGRWLATTVSHAARDIAIILHCVNFFNLQSTNLPHQILGITALAAVGINVSIQCR